MAFDLVIHDGWIVDGSGGEPFAADVGVVDGRIVEIGRISTRARQDIAAEGRVIAPGFIDGHTHMDAQMFWEKLGRSSCYHGVTSVVMGNCGFTLAPSREGERALVVRNLEKAEEIPAEAMALGIPWGWESFREYLDVIDRLPKGINYAAQIGHSALRTWAMGERAFEEQASETDLAVMQGELRDAISAGAVGFSTRREGHMTSDGRPVASRIASWDEVCQLVGVLRGTGAAFQLRASNSYISKDLEARSASRGELRNIACDSQVPLVLGLNLASAPEGSDVLDFMSSVRAEGGQMFGLSHSRGISELFSFRTELPFDECPEWKRVRQASFVDQERLFRDPAIRRVLVEEAHNLGIENIEEAHNLGIERRTAARTGSTKVDTFDDIIYQDKVLPPNPSIEDVARSRGIDPIEAMIDLALETDFNAIFKRIPRQWQDELLLKAMRYPYGAMTFSDAGAHVARISDSSIQTYLLAYWFRERKEFSLQEAVRMMTSAPASIWNLTDRGLVKEGYVADLNVFDADQVAPLMPTVEKDFPGGVAHLQQKATGIEATIVAGEITLRKGEPTGALPGRLIRRQGAKFSDRASHAGQLRQA